MRTFLTVIVTIIVFVAVVAIGSYVYLKTHVLSARAKPSGIEATLAGLALEISTPAKYRTLSNPVPATPDTISEGMHHYAHMCAVCHGNDGAGQTETAQGLYPPVPDLRSKDTQSMADGEIYNVIKNGIPFSGMPAWNEEEPNYWKIVNFVRHLPSMTKAEVEQVTKMSGITANTNKAPDPCPNLNIQTSKSIV